jgi:hypothetical protein
MSKVFVNQVISDNETGERYLILWIAPGNEYGYCYGLDSRSRKPKQFDTVDIISTPLRYEIIPHDFPGITRTDDSFTEKELAHRERIWGMLQSAVTNEPDIYDSKRRFAILREIVDNNSIKPNDLYALLDKYWRSGKTKNAFIPGYSNCGAKGERRRSYKKRDGLTTTIEKTLTDSDRKNFVTAIKKHYLKRDKLSFKAVYEKLIQDFYT